jgi:phosphatidylserine decarboxylase
VLASLSAFIFRFPVSNSTSKPLAILSPCFGKILSLDRVRVEKLSADFIKLTIRNSWYHPHALFSPVEGKIMNAWTDLSLSDKHRRRCLFWIQTDEGNDILIGLVLGRLSFSTSAYLQTGQRIGQGQFCGYIYLCGDVEIYLPETTRMEMILGDVVSAGSDHIARLIR